MQALKKELLIQTVRAPEPIDVARRLWIEEALERLSDLFVRHGVPNYIRSDNGPEFTARKVRKWLA